MTPALNRREFLKLAGSLSLAPLLRVMPAGRPAQAGARPNVIVIVFDALSAAHLPAFGYPRQTTPNLERLGQRATVYRRHHSASNFTTPSTASLFTGAYPWAHRVFTLNGLISPEMEPNNLFRLLGERYFQAAFAQNIYADMLVSQLQRSMGQHLGPDAYSLAGRTLYDKVFRHDAVDAMKSYDGFLFKREEAHGSLFASILGDIAAQINLRLAEQHLAGQYPEGLPRLANTDVYFTIDQVMAGVQELLAGLPAPFFAYLHLMPPHAPYTPETAFKNTFKDGWAPKPKKKHPLGNRTPEERLNELRQDYDEYLANLDAGFGRLLDALEQSGLLETSYLIVTSDHGELFERGVHGHTSPLLYEAGLHVPLLIAAPGQHEPQEITDLTSNVDLLPTWLALAGIETPTWAEGRVLPGLGLESSPDGERSIFALEAQKNLSRRPLTTCALALLRGRYKLLRYLGYKYEAYEFYDLENDPEERDDQYGSHPMARELQAELDAKLAQVNAPYAAT